MNDFQYTPRSVGVIRRHARTMTPATIAEIMRCSVGTVELICRKHDMEMIEQDAPVPTARVMIDERVLRKTKIQVSISDLTLTGINMEAKTRGLTAAQLVSLLITTVVADNLYVAVLGSK